MWRNEHPVGSSNMMEFPAPEHTTAANQLNGSNAPVILMSITEEVSPPSSIVEAQGVSSPRRSQRFKHSAISTMVSATSELLAKNVLSLAF